MRMILPVAGVGLLFAGTALHPMHADPAAPEAAFAEYAADRVWLLSHLMQFLGAAALAVSFLAVTQRDARTLPVVAARAGAVAGLAVAAALQAVDGVALKQMVDLWSAASGGDRGALFASALAVRSIEVGLAAFYALVMGLTLALFGLATMGAPGRQPVLGLVGVTAGLALAGGGLMTGAAGFAALPMNVNMAASLAALGWYLVAVWRKQAPN